MYGIASIYTVSVCVSNALSKQPLTAQLAAPIPVVEVIDKLHAQVVGESYVVPLRDCGATERIEDGSSLPSTSFKYGSPTRCERRDGSFLDAKEITKGPAGSPATTALSSSSLVECEQSDAIWFEAWVWRGSDVTFTFEFGDGVTERADAILNERSMPTAIVAHRYKKGQPSFCFCFWFWAGILRAIARGRANRFPGTRRFTTDLVAREYTRHF